MPTVDLYGCNCCDKPCLSCDPPPRRTVNVDTGADGDWDATDGFNANCTDAVCRAYGYGGIRECSPPEDGFAGTCCSYSSPPELVCIRTQNRYFQVIAALCGVMGGFEWRVTLLFMPATGVGAGHALTYTSAVMDWDRCRELPVTCSNPAITATTGTVACVWGGGSWPATVEVQASS